MLTFLIGLLGGGGIAEGVVVGSSRPGGWRPSRTRAGSSAPRRTRAAATTRPAGARRRWATGWCGSREGARGARAPASPELLPSSLRRSEKRRSGFAAKSSVCPHFTQVSPRTRADLAGGPQRPAPLEGDDPGQHRLRRAAAAGAGSASLRSRLLVYPQGYRPVHRTEEEGTAWRTSMSDHHRRRAPPAYTAAIYAARANLAPLVIEGERVGDQPGGQLMLTTDVENYPGFPEGVMGPELMMHFRDQAERFGTAADHGEGRRGRPLRASPSGSGSTTRSTAPEPSSSPPARSRACSGCEARSRLRSATACRPAPPATASSSGSQEMVVVGGGDSAMEEALFLTKFASKVTIVHRRDEFRASKIMQDRARANDKVEFLWDTVVDDLVGDGKLEGVQVREREDGRARRRSRPRRCSWPSATPRTPRSSPASWTWTRRATSSP